MSISAEFRDRVRQRAQFACEFCGVSETDTAAQLTIDHFQPRTQGGSDDFDNLIYCCHRCNEYKADYWPAKPTEPMLWNPRREIFDTHFLPLADGTLYAKTPTGEFTLRRVRLNRPPLVAYRLRKQQHAEEQRLFMRRRDVLALLEQLLQQETTLLKENRDLLEMQGTLLRLLLEK